MIRNSNMVSLICATILTMAYPDINIKEPIPATDIFLIQNNDRDHNSSPTWEYGFWDLRFSDFIRMKKREREREQEISTPTRKKRRARSGHLG